MESKETGRRLMIKFMIFNVQMTKGVIRKQLLLVAKNKVETKMSGDDVMLIALILLVIKA